MRRRRRERGFTLLEIVIALAIVGALLVIAFGGMRVAIAAWTRGENRAEVHQHLRGIALILDRAISAAYPYRAPIDDNPTPVVLFRGTTERLEFVTTAPPFPFSIPVAFTALTLGLETEQDVKALVVRQRVLPNRNPFTEATPFLRDPEIGGIEFRYLNEVQEWVDAWDAENENGLPRAVRVTVSVVRDGRLESLPPLTVQLRTGVVQ